MIVNVLLALVMLATNSGTTENHHLKPIPQELSTLIGLEFNMQNIDRVLHIMDSNGQGQIVGTSHFKDGLKVKEIAWFWDPKTGFSIIADMSLLFSDKLIADFYDPRNTNFQFKGLKINNKGEVSGVYSFQKNLGGRAKKTYYDLREGWFWWSSKDKGLHPTTIPSNTSFSYSWFIIQNLDDDGDIMFSVYQLTRNPSGQDRIINFPVLTNINVMESCFKKLFLQKS